MKQESPLPPEPQVIHVARPVDPPEVALTPAQRQRCAESRAMYPQLNLSPGEFIISAVKRHIIGLIAIWGVIALIIVVILLILPLYVTNQATIAAMFNASEAQLPSTAVISTPLLFIIGLFVLGGAIATYVYNGNRFFLTNESVIQEIQTSLFSKKEQTISLVNIEDASYRQHGILQTVLNYGSLRLSTQGEETTYRFNYVANPKEQIAKLNNAVEAFKNGRPVEIN